MARISHQKLAVIHLTKKQLGLTDEEYRRQLYQSTGVYSAKDLTESMFRRLMNDFVRSSHYQVNSFGMTVRQKWFIERLSQQMGWDSQHLDHFIHRFFHERGLRDLNKKEASHLIEALKKIRARYQHAVLHA